jgi:hypothetical protein
MKTTCLNPATVESDNRFDESVVHESTYALLVRSEEKCRSLLETALYFLVVLSAMTAIWQFVHQPIALPLNGIVTIADATSRTAKSPLCPSATRG